MEKKIESQKRNGSSLLDLYYVRKNIRHVRSR